MPQNVSPLPKPGAFNPNDRLVEKSAEEFLTPKQLAARLPVTVSTIWDWTRRRNRNPIPHYPISRKVVLYKWSEVVKWVESQRAK